MAAKITPPKSYPFFLLAFIALLLIRNNVCAQTKSEITRSKKIYEGTWFNKKEKRYLRIYYDAKVDYVTISDWEESQSEDADVYKAFIKGEKLILYAENNDHHAPYCEIELANKKLVYQCNNALNFTDNFLNTKEAGNKIIFQRVKK